MREEQFKLGDGVVGYMAEDPGEKGRFLWSVRWPAHACYMVRPKGKDADVTPDKWHCAIGEEFGQHAPQAFRSGVAMGHAKARAAIDEAHNLGRPKAGAKQFVMSHRSG